MSLPKVSCISSPYEADAQLAKLCIDGIADAVVTEVCIMLFQWDQCHCYQLTITVFSTPLGF